MFPDTDSRMSSSEPAWPSSAGGTADVIRPATQKPHGNPGCSMNAFYTECSSSLRAGLSIVVISRPPAAAAAGVGQDTTRRPPAWTVHVPHRPRAQPFFVSVGCGRSRRASSKVTRGSSHAAGTAAASSPGVATRAAMAEVPAVTPLVLPRNPRRETLPLTGRTGFEESFIGSPDNVPGITAESNWTRLADVRGLRRLLRQQLPRRPWHNATGAHRECQPPDER